MCAIDAGSGQCWFGPRLSYALAVAELADLEAAERIAVRTDGLALLDTTVTEEPHADEALSALDEKWPPRGSPLTVLWWARWRGPRCIDPYLSAAWHAGITDVTDGVLTVLDPGPIHAAAARLISVLEDREPTREDVAFAVLADAAQVTRPHLRGRMIPASTVPAYAGCAGKRSAATMVAFSARDGKRSRSCPASPRRTRGASTSK